jgi:valyl-tRNA synthetase
MLENLKVLHPFMPLTEEIWQILAREPRRGIDSFNLARIKTFNATLIADFENAAEVISELEPFVKTRIFL